MSVNPLGQTLNTLSPVQPLPLALPVVHITSARAFRAIVNRGALVPSRCAVFGEDILYFFYGGGFYRPRNHQTKNADELPVAFMFDPAFLKTRLRFYPCDTGALASGLLACKAAAALEPFRDVLRVDGNCDPNVPCTIVYHLFGTNDRYIRGELDPGCAKKPDPLPTLLELMSTDLTACGVDHRQSIIEGQVLTPVSLRQHLLWVGFPETLTDVFADLYELTRPSLPDYHTYSSHVNFNPAQVAAQLEMRAGDVIRRFTALPEGRQ